MRRFLWMLSICFLPLFIKAQTTTPSAADVMKTAETKAGKEHKNVLVIFHASWCHWCHAMDTAINDASCKAFFERNYVIEHLTVLESKGKEASENPGAIEMLKKYAGDNSGIPFWMVFDPKGNVLADSKLPSGDNMGCPGTESELAQFKVVLNKTAKGTPAEIAAVEKRFKATATK